MTSGPAEGPVPSDGLDLAVQRARAHRDGPGRVAPAAEERRLLDDLPTTLPDTPTSADEVVELLDRLVEPNTPRSIGGRYFGFVNGGTQPAALASAVLTATWDQNLALPVMSPGPATVDTIAAGWIRDLLGLPERSVVTFCGGASIANLTGVLAGRDALLHRLGWSVAERGTHGAPPLRIVMGTEAHVSAVKAVRIAGFGTDNIEWVRSDAFGRLDPSALPPLDDHTLVVLQAGNVNTGHSDPFTEILPAVGAAGAWAHVDGAFGLWAAASPAHRHEVAGVEAADSWATDAHKWLNAPYDSGICAVRDGDDLRRVTATDAAYVETSDERALMHLGLQMSQKARGVESYAALLGFGRDGLVEIIDRTCALARRFAERLADGGVEVLCPPALNQALVSFGDDATTDAVVAAVQADGRLWAGATTWQGRRAMRLSVSSHASTPDDIDECAEVVLTLWRQLPG